MRVCRKKKMERKKGKEPSTKVKDQIGLQNLIAGPSRKEGGWVRGREPIRSVRGRATAGE